MKVVFVNSHQSTPGRVAKGLMRAMSQVSTYDAQIEQLQTALDNSSTLRWDLEERCANQVLRICELESKLEGAHSNAQREQTDTEKRYASVVRQLEASENNRKHVMEIMEGQKKTIEMAKAEMDKLRAAKVSDEHLARKLIELASENHDLAEDLQAVRSDMHRQINEAKEIWEKKDIRAYEAPPSEIRQYQEQTTRLLQEKVQLQGELDHTKDLLSNSNHELKTRTTNMSEAIRIYIGGLATIKTLSVWDILFNKAKTIATQTLAAGETPKILPKL